MNEEQLQNTIPNVAKATKQELMDAYRELLGKHKQPQQMSLDKTPEVKIPAYQTNNDITQAINATRATVNTALQDVENKMTGKISELKQVEDVIKVRQNQLKELYELDQAAGSLMAVLRAKEEADRVFEQDKEILNQKRKRDEEEYKFSFDLQKRKDKETYEVEKRKWEEALAQRETELHRGQQELSTHQQDLENLRQQVQEFPQRLDTEKQQLSTQLQAEAKRDKDTSLLLLQKEMEAQKTVQESRIKNLEVLIEEQKNHIRSLEQQLQAAQAQVQEVVIKSIEGSSNTKALDAVNKFAHEQSKHNNS